VLDTKLVQAVEIFLPGQDEQRAIAAALSDVDALLTALDRLIAKKRAVKTAAMQQLLTGRQRLPGFSGAWETKRLGEVLLDVFGGGTPSRSNATYWGGPIPWATVKDISSFDADGTQETITAAGLSNSASNYVPAGTLILAVRMLLGKAVIYKVGIAINQDLKALVFDRIVSVSFMFYWFERMAVHIDSLGSGSTVRGLALADLRALALELPPIPEQTAIAAVLSDMDTEIAALKARREKTRQIKRGMMQELLTGRTRLVQTAAPAAMKDATAASVRRHSWAFNEAVVIAMLAKRFGSDEYPLGRKRYTKLAYLLHRHVEKQPEGYLKKAAGPYNPRMKYGGPERLALEKRYVREAKAGKYAGFVDGEEIDRATSYFTDWYGEASLQWLEQFRYETNDALGVLTTVDMAVREIRAGGHKTSVAEVKRVLRDSDEWRPKLERADFSDAAIADALHRCAELFGRA
jgi:type I restriction enzyme S subunit